MSTQANLVFTDAFTVATDHTVEPNGIERLNGVEIAHYRENLANVPLDGQVSAKFTRRTLPSGVKQVTMDLSIPVLENVTGGTSLGYTAPPKVAYVERATVTLFAHPRSTKEGRRSIRRWLATVTSGLNAVNGVLIDGTAPADLLDKVIFPS